MEIKYKLIADATESAKFIEDLAAKTFKGRDKLRKDIQIALVATAYHAWKHGDWTLINKLCNPNGGKTAHDGNSKLVKWACKFIGLEIGEATVKNEKGKEEKVKMFGKWKGKEYVEANFETARKTMWFSFAESSITAWDINDVIRKAMKTNITRNKKLTEADCPEELKAVTKTTIDHATMQSMLQFMGLPVDDNGNIVFETIKEPAKA